MTTTWLGFTVDGPTSMDLDDAIWVVRRPDGWDVDVTIADVASTVPKGSPLDVGDAERRGAHARVHTRYYAGGNDPMLPRSLSEGKLSLLPKRRRSAMRIALRLDPDGTLDALPEVSFGPFASAARLAYPEIPAILADADHPMHGPVVDAVALSETLLTRRRAAGALAIYDLAHGWATNEEGGIVPLGRDEATVGYVLVQELMILANAAVARLCAESDVPVLYRTHVARPHAPSRGELLDELASLALSIEALDDLRARMRMVLGRARYEPVLRSHYGLGLPAYLHATSPIRRYPDLVVQRQLLARARGEPFPYAHEDLAALGEQVQATLDVQEAELSARARERAHRFAIAAAATTERLASLSPREFERSVRLNIESARARNTPPGEILRDAIRLRIASGDLSTMTRLHLLFDAPSSWADVVGAVFADLVARPHEAMAVLHVATQAGRTTHFDTGANALTVAPVPPWFAGRASAERDGAKMRAMAKASSSKLAVQRASVALLAKLVWLPDPVWGDREPEAAAPAAPKMQAPPSTDNPVGALGEFCIVLRLDAPSYAFRQEGPPHLPTFACTCTVAGLQQTATGASKREAKARAAAAVVGAMRARAGASG